MIGICTLSFSPHFYQYIYPSDLVSRSNAIDFFWHIDIYMYSIGDGRGRGKGQNAPLGECFLPLSEKSVRIWNTLFCKGNKVVYKYDI